MKCPRIRVISQRQTLQKLRVFQDSRPPHHDSVNYAIRGYFPDKLKGMLRQQDRSKK